MMSPEDALHLVMAELDPTGTLAASVNKMQIEHLDFEADEPEPDEYDDEAEMRADDDRYQRRYGDDD